MTEIVKVFIAPLNHNCSWSTGIHDGLTVGRGKLDEHGYWEFPCYECSRASEIQFPEQGEIWPFKKRSKDERE